MMCGFWSLAPFAGIIRIRFNGYDLRLKNVQPPHDAFDPKEYGSGCQERPAGSI